MAGCASRPPASTPRAAATSSWPACVDLARVHGITFAYHHAPTRQRVDQYVATHGRRPLLDFGELGLLTPNVRATHMVHLDDAELKVLIGSGAT